MIIFYDKKIREGNLSIFNFIKSDLIVKECFCENVSVSYFQIFFFLWNKEYCFWVYVYNKSEFN